MIKATMTDYYLIFYISVFVNIGISLKSSDYWKKLLQKFGYGHLAGLPPTTSVSAGSSGGFLTSLLLDSTNNGDDGDDDSSSIESRKRYTSLLSKYLVVYLMATFSDWLQGPYVYALYDDYGYSQHDIAVLFVAGFGSSMIFGSFIGGMADWGGRRAFVVLFAIIYALSCFTKHFHSFGILMIGRLLGGVATSLLFSVFEAWLIRAHADSNCEQYLSNSFSWAAYGNSVIAILAGLIANHAASSFPMKPIAGNFNVGGYLNPFDISLVALLLCGFLAFTLWEENYGEDKKRSVSETGQEETPQEGGKWYDGLKNAFIVVTRSREILLCGVISSIFEGSMYIFVFMWTPSLTSQSSSSDEGLPFGVIFSTFMVCCMTGSTIFGCLVDGKFKFISNGKRFKLEELAMYEFAVASAAMAVIALSGENTTIKFVAMNVFEVVVGMYWPTMGTLKSSIVPEDLRVAIYNLFRIPLNFIVLFSLLTDLSPNTSFTLNSVLLIIATFCQYCLSLHRAKHKNSDSSSNTKLNEESVPLKVTNEV